jgi:beta-galactosidase
LAPLPVNDWTRGTWPPPHILYGGDYNPEQWPAEVWREDVRLMREAGVNLATVGVFSWAKLEPSPGEFDFGWLHEVLGLLHDGGVAADLATPTAAVPPWLTTRYPSVLPVTARGERLGQGSRQTFCVNAPEYRRFADRIVTALAGEFGDHPALRTWHVHNEYACELPACYCDRCAIAFRDWLRTRYGTVDEMNEAWGAAFWSQHYQGFEEVLPPRVSTAQNNPGQLLDYRRFTSDAYLADFRLQRRILREITPDVPVTTNFMGFFEPLDYFGWAAEEDFCSTDNYPDPADPEASLRSAMHYDLVRSLRRDVPWLLMEQTTLRVNWRSVNAAKAPGQMRRLSYQALARGAAGICFFQWRAAKAGAERFHSAMVPHAGTASPVWREVKQLGSELTALSTGPGSELTGAPVAADTAIVFSWPSWWALEQPGQPSDQIRALDQARWLYRPLYEAGRTVDFVHPSADFSGYNHLLVPSLFLVTEAEAANILDYINSGGTAVISFWSGIVDEANTVHPGPYGGPLRPAIGADVLDVAPLPGTVLLTWHDGRQSEATHWMDIMEVTDGEVLARYDSGPWAGSPAVVGKRLGSGRALYLGTRLDNVTLRDVLGISPAPQPNVERVTRRTATASYEFLLNHGDAEATVTLDRDGTDLLTSTPLSGVAKLPAGDVLIIRSSPPDSSPKF